MNIDLILKIAGLGILVGAICQVLSKTGRDEQAMLLSVAGAIAVTLLVVKELSSLIGTIRTVFGL